MARPFCLIEHTVIHPTRVQLLNRRPERKGRYVLYWMQAAHRVRFNHALDYATLRANERRMPLLVFFGLTDRFPRAMLRHYVFMLQGLAEVSAELADRGIQMLVLSGDPPAGVIALGQAASMVVVDKGYLRIQRTWYRAAAERLDCPLVQVETDVVIPLQVASEKEEYAARTLRPKIERQLDAYLQPLPQVSPNIPSLGMDVGTPSLDLSAWQSLLDRLSVDYSVPPVSGFVGGAAEAQRRLKTFLEQDLARYELHNDPALNCQSQMSPYLHFGQISPLEIALRVRQAGGPGVGAYLEQLIVRRELARNLIWYNPAYDSFDGLPAWAQRTLQEHAQDVREYLYPLDDLEAGATHDAYWNAAQHELVRTGKMHGYMRMYWGKKLLEWSRTPREAYQIAVSLNDKYSLDGRDPNGYAGVAWCFGKHDRPWKERPVFGSIRYMSAAGLERKFDIQAYVRRVEEGTDEPRPSV